MGIGGNERAWPGDLKGGLGASIKALNRRGLKRAKSMAFNAINVRRLREEGEDWALTGGARGTVIEGKKWKEGRGGGLLASRAGARAGLLGWPFSNFFLTKDFLPFSRSKTNTTFKQKLQMSSNLFLNFCRNKIYLTRHNT